MVVLHDPLAKQNFIRDSLLLCSEDFPASYRLPPISAALYDSLIWSHGQSGDEISITQEGLYTVNAYDVCASYQDTLKVVRLPSPLLPLPADTFLCEGSSLILNIPDAAQIQWSNGSQNDTIIIDLPGQYSVQVSNQEGCYARASISVNKIPAPSDILGPDQSIFFSEHLLLKPLSFFESYLWDDGSQEPQRPISQEGVYSIIVKDRVGCEWKDSIRITQLQAEPILPSFTATDAFISIQYLKPDSKLFIFNTLGQIVFASDAYDNRLINRFASGMYIIRLLEPDGKEYVQKMISGRE
jgi:hypothetical protein